MGIVNPANSENMTFSVHRQFATGNNQLKQVFQRLSSLQRINQASDDAAGLAISERMLSQLNGLNMAERNVMDGGSASNVMDSYTSNMGEDLQRMRELAVQASSGTYTDEQRANLNAEFSQLQQNLGQTIQTANFNGQPLLSAEGGIAIADDANGSRNITIPTVDMAASSATGIGNVLDNASFNITSASGAAGAIATLDEAIGKVASTRATIGATASRLDKAASGIQGLAQAQAESRGRIIDADMARETSRMTGLQIRQQAGVAMMGQASNFSAAFVQGMLGSMGRR